MNKRYFLVLFILSLGLVSGCATRAPTIAHTHVGHAMEGWHDTPGKKGLFEVAEDKAQLASRHAERAAEDATNLKKVKAEISKVLIATDTFWDDEGETKVEAPYGLKQALTGAIDHITFAANSDDASINVKNSTSILVGNVAVVLDRCDLITALGDEIQASDSKEEVGILLQEVRSLTHANLHGIDSNGDGVVGSNSEEMGIKQLRVEIENMIAREDPPYATVDRWYLFNLVRLPSGEWIFKTVADWDGGGGGGGY